MNELKNVLMDFCLICQCPREPLECDFDIGNGGQNLQSSFHGKTPFYTSVEAHEL